jgi:hypothetical protein
MKGKIFGLTAWVLALLAFIPKAILWIIQATIYYVPLGIFRCCVPLKIRSKVRVARRSTIKGGLHLEQKAEIQMDAYRSTSEEAVRPRRRCGGGEGRNVPLSSFLRTYDLLILVARELHYVDVVNLACTSRSVREAVLPAHDFDRRTAVLSRYTCDNRKTRCWLCANQVCEVHTYHYYPSFAS